MIRGLMITCEPDPRAIARPCPMLDLRRSSRAAVWQKLKAGIEAKLAEEQSGVKEGLGRLGIRGVGDQVAGLRLDGKSPSGLLGIQYGLADKLVLSKIPQGDRHGHDAVRGVGCGVDPAGGAALLPGSRIPVYEVWGMSESTGASTLTSPDNLAIGTVGRPIPGVEVKLGDDGELFVRGPVVMAGYRNQPEKTAETIDADGWLATGDIAEIGPMATSRSSTARRNCSSASRARTWHQHRERHQGGLTADQPDRRLGDGKFT